MFGTGREELTSERVDIGSPLAPGERVRLAIESARAGELITVILAPSPIADLPPGRSALKLARERADGWEKAWAAPAKRLELPGGAERLYTPAERDAGGTTARLLTQRE